MMNKKFREMPFNERVRFFEDTVNEVVKDHNDIRNYYDGLRAVLITFYIDTSGSMESLEGELNTGMRDVLTNLDEKNQNAEDWKFEVKIVTFNDSVHELNTEFLEPGQLLELLDSKTFECGGGTNLTAIVNRIDADCSRTAQGYADAHTGAAKPIHILITDYVGTDADSTREAAQNRLMSNRLYTEKSVNLCVFVGPENRRNKVEALAGGADNVIALSENLSSYLTPMVMESSVLSSVETHVAGTTAGVAAQAKAHKQQGEESAEELMKAINEALNKKAEGEA